MKRLTHTRGVPPSLFGKPAFARTEPGAEEAAATAAADEAAALAGAAEQGASATTASTPSGGTSGSQEDQAFEAPFRLEDVDESYRADVERYVKQVQGAYTRKTQELAQQRDALKPYQTLQERLESDDEAIRDAAVEEVLKNAGWENTSTPAEEAAAAAADETTPAATTSADPELAARLEAIEQRDQEREQQEYLATFTSKVDTGLDAYYRELGLDKIEDQTQREAAQTRERQAVIAHLGTLQPLEGEMPDIEGAVSLRKADVAAIEQATQAKYRASKDVPDTLAGGTSGRSATDTLGDGDKRRQRAMEIAGRHL